jgi:metal-responsive CopG/Arc/MetJ family transcriptional regulator
MYLAMDMVARRVNISIPGVLAERIDKERGDVSRSRFVLRLLEKAYNIRKEERIR